MSFNPRSHRGLAAGIFLLAAGLSEAVEKPNILVIWGDDIGWSNVSAYNHAVMGYQTASEPYGQFHGMSRWV